MSFRSCASAFILFSFFIMQSRAQDGPESALRPSKSFAKKVVVAGLANPWEITWGPDNMLWVTERSAKRVTRVNPATGEQMPAITIDEAVAPGGQEGLMGMTLHPQLLKGSDFVYVAYTYIDKDRPADPRVTDARSPFRQIYSKIVRLTYDPASGKLGQPVTVIAGLPAGNDHNGMRLKYGPDAKLYLTIGDQGNNQLGNFCNPVLAQRLPVASEVAKADFSAYEGKVLRINLDGSIPKDNPRLAGVVSHVLTYGHRNQQGIDFGSDGTLYESEHGPKTDDEVNVLVAGKNYGWPNVAGLRDNKAYEFARWAESKTPCAQLRFSDLAIHPDVPRQAETDFKEPFVEPIATLFTVPTGFNFEDPACRGVNFICWPTVAPSSIEYYEARSTGIPGWSKALFITTLKRGSVYVLPLTPDGKKAAGKMSRYFQANNRYRDSAVSPDGRTIYLATDSSGMSEAVSGGATSNMEDKGAILAFTYTGEGVEITQSIKPSVTAPDAGASKPAPQPKPANAIAPSFTAKQAAEGKKAYMSNCAVCHGNTLTNGHFGTPLAGKYFREKWSGKSVAPFYEKSKAMPPAAPASLSKDRYEAIVAYILEVNGYKPGASALVAGSEAANRMWIE